MALRTVPGRSRDSRRAAESDTDAASLCEIEDRYELLVAPSARRPLAEQLPQSVAFAAYEFVIGPLLDNPVRVGKQLRPPLDDRRSARRGTYRVIYRIEEEQRNVTVVAEFPRSAAYRNG